MAFPSIPTSAVQVHQVSRCPRKEE